MPSISQSKNVKERAISQDILAQRAHEYARHEEKREIIGTLQDYMGFELGQETYLIEMPFIDEILRLGRISRLPRQKNFIAGVMNIRGNIALIADIRKLIGIPDAPSHDFQKIILIKHENETTGFIADKVMGIQTFDTGRLQKNISTFQGVVGNFIKGVYEDNNKHFICLEVEKVFFEISKQLMS